MLALPLEDVQLSEQLIEVRQMLGRVMKVLFIYLSVTLHY